MHAFPIAAIAIVVALNSVSAQPTINEIIKKVEATFEPADARPGQTVTLKIKLELLDGWHTYPLKQDDPGAKAQINKLTFPEPGSIVFVGELLDPLGAKEKAEPLAQIEKMFYYPGGATWERKAVVLPNAAPGAVTSIIKFRVLVCDKNNCLPPKPLTLDATLKVTGAPMEIDPQYRAEVEKALKK